MRDRGAGVFLVSKQGSNVVISARFASHRLRADDAAPTSLGD